MYTVQLHSSCTFTCFKSKHFCSSCRIAKPSKKIDVTQFTQLRKRQNQADEIIIPLRDKDIDHPPNTV